MQKGPWASPHQTRAVAQVISAGVDRIGQVVEVLARILQISEPSHGVVDATTCLTEAVHQVSEQVGPDIEIRTRLPDEIIDVRASGTQLSHVFSCLLNNAVASITGPGTIEISAVTTASQVIFQISDTGRGMTPDEVDAAYQFGFIKRDGRVRLRTGLATVKSAVDAAGERSAYRVDPALAPTSPSAYAAPARSTKLELANPLGQIIYGYADHRIVGD